MSGLVSYEEAVDILRSDKDLTSLVKCSYLDVEVSEAWNRFLVSEEWKEVLNILNISDRTEVLNILDIGCGNGIASMAFAETGNRIVALDPDSSKSVGCGAIDSQSHSNMQVVRSFAENLPFASNAFDIVYGRQVLHHFASLNKGLLECQRILRRGGQALFCREHVVDNQDALNEFLKHHPLHRYHGGEHAYPLKQYINAFNKAGFIVSRVIAPFDSVINHYPTTNGDVKEWLNLGLRKRLGAYLANLIKDIKLVEILYRKLLSHKCKTAGRLYTFLLEKP